MLRFCSILLVVFTTSLGSIGSQSSCVIEVEVTGFSNFEGDLIVALFNDDKEFLKNDYKHVTLHEIAERCVVRFENIPSGTYAVSVIHDENRNGALDSNFLGIPNEKYGFSNNVIGTFGPPKFEKSSFHAQNLHKISIKLR